MADPVEQLTGPVSAHGEGPVWSPAWGGLRWVDLTAGDVLALDPDGPVRRWPVGPVAAAIRPRSGGGMVLALDRRFALAGDWGTPVEPLEPLWADEQVRFNDGGCDPDGGFWCGSTGEDYAAGRGALYRLGPDGLATRRIEGLGVSNGLAWTADGHTAYYADTLTERVDRFDYDADRGLHNRRPFVRIPVESGMPDGLTVDADGGVWVTLWNGGAVHRYDPAGRLDAVIEFPVRRVTACTFGGPELDQLYVTSTRNGAEPGEATTAGALFRVAAGVRGLPVRPFAG
jgi:sugar lactone lactonase YvrE